MQADRSRDLTRTTFQLLALGALIASTFWILRPFLVALTWATMIAVATWPLLLQAQAWLGGRRSLAVALLTITFSLGAGRATTRNTRGLTRSVIALMVPPLPAPSRPSKMIATLRPSCTTHCWTATSSPCSLRSARS